MVRGWPHVGYFTSLVFPCQCSVRINYDYSFQNIFDPVYSLYNIYAFIAAKSRILRKT